MEDRNVCPIRLLHASPSTDLGQHARDLVRRKKRYSIRDIEPAAYPVEGEELFRKIVAELTSLLVFDKDETDLPSGAIATALWIMSTHYYEPFPAEGDPPRRSVRHHPTRLMISAGTIRSGKTRLLDTTACLGRRVLRASNVWSEPLCSGHASASVRP